MEVTWYGEDEEVIQRQSTNLEEIKPGRFAGFSTTLALSERDASSVEDYDVNITNKEKTGENRWVGAVKEPDSGSVSANTKLMMYASEMWGKMSRKRVLLVSAVLLAIVLSGSLGMGEGSEQEYVADIGDMVVEELDKIGVDSIGPLNTTEVSPGDVVTRNVTLGNSGSTTTTFYATLYPQDEGGVLYTNSSLLTKDDAKEVLLNASESKTVEVSWTVPKDIQEGKYDLVTELWRDSNSNELDVLIGDDTETNAINVTKGEGKLNVTSNPDGATIVVDGSISGSTPLTENFSVGIYDVAAVLDGYPTVHETVTVDKNQTTQLSVDLTQPDPPNFRFGEITDITKTRQGAPFSVSAVVANTGDSTDEQEIEYRFNGSVVSTENVTLSPGRSKLVSFIHSEDTPGEYNYEVSSDNSTKSADVTVEKVENFTVPLINSFSQPPQNTGELNATLYEDLDGDGDGLEIGPAIDVFGEIFRRNLNGKKGLGLTPAQAEKLNWDDDSPKDTVTVDDMITLFGKKFREQLGS